MMMGERARMRLVSWLPRHKRQKIKTKERLQRRNPSRVTMSGNCWGTFNCVVSSDASSQESEDLDSIQVAFKEGIFN